MKQNTEIRFKCTSEEKNKIKDKAKSVGMNIKQYLLYVGKNTTIRVTLG